MALRRGRLANYNYLVIDRATSRIGKNTDLLITIRDNFAAYKVRSILSHNSYDINQLKVKVKLNDPHFVILALPPLKAIDSLFRKSRETGSFRLN